jgi:recombination protein RecA
MTEKKKEPEVDPRLVEILTTSEKDYGKGALQLLDGGQCAEAIPVISSESLALDRALGIGGYPRGRIVEIFGPESSGKTTLSLHAIASAQRAGGIAAFIDAEHAFDASYAKRIGVNPSKLLISQPDNGEQGLDIAELLASTGTVDLIVIDSVAALVPKAEIEGDMGEPHVGLHARLIGQAARKLNGIASKSKTTILFINQLRQKIGVFFGNPETTTGGLALKFYCSIRMDVRRIGKVEAGDTAVGSRTRVKIVKNKCAPPFTEAEFDIRWGVGIDAAADLLDQAEALGVLQKNGSHYSLSGKAFAQGREKAREAVVGNAELRTTLERETRRVLRGESVAAEKNKAA